MTTVNEVLSNSTITGNVLYLPDVILDRKLYVNVAKQLEIIGGTWKSKQKGFIFNSDPNILLEQILGEDNENLKKKYQFFQTQPETAKYLVELAEINESHSICEPSAGQGAIIDSILASFPKNNIFYCEKMPSNLTILNRKYQDISNIFYLNPLNDDFLELKSKFDRIVANPPFASNQDVLHIQHMYECLKENGKLVAIASVHWKTCDNKKETEFRKWLNEKNAEIIDLPEGTFKDSGTMIRSCIIVINKN